MANLILVTPVSVYGDDFPIVATGGPYYINAKKIVALQACQYLNSSNVSTTGAEIFYATQRKGWREGVTKIIVTQSVATIISSIGTLSSGKKIALPASKKGGTSYVTNPTTVYINVDDIILLTQSSADALLASPGQCEVYVQEGVWGSVMYTVSLTPAAVLALIAGAGTNGLVTLSQTIGFPGSGVDNFNFTSASNKTAQNIQIATIPAFAIVQNLTIMNTVAFVATGGPTNLNVTLGNSSADNTILTSTDLHALNSFAAGTLTDFALSASAVNVWLGATPVGTGSNWSTFSAGQLKVVINYINQN